MPDYRKMYLTLFDAVERTLEILDAPEQDTALAKDLLIAAQQTCEDIYVDTAGGQRRPPLQRYNIPASSIVRRGEVTPPYKAVRYNLS